MSLPTWERGLKYCTQYSRRKYAVVAPHVGAWIEILWTWEADMGYRVAPHVGAWIEINIEYKYQSHSHVAPHVGAWIEISLL